MIKFWTPKGPTMDPVNSGPFYPGNRVRLTPECVARTRSRGGTVPDGAEGVVRGHRRPDSSDGEVWYGVDLEVDEGYSTCLREQDLERVR